MSAVEISEQILKEDLQTVSQEAINVIDRGEADSANTAVATAIGNTIPNDRGGEDYKVDLLVRATPIVEDAIEDGDSA